MRLTLCASLILLILIAEYSIYAQVSYGVSELGTLGGNFSRAYGINDSGHVVGVTNTAGNLMRAFIWKDGNMINLGVLANDGISREPDINISGKEGNYDALGGEGSYAAAINDSGLVAGHSYIIQGNQRAVLWQDGNIFNLGTLGGTDSHASAINNSGHVAGSSSNASGMYVAALWQNGNIIDLGTLGGTSSQAHAINNSGQVAGYSTHANFEYSAFLWQNGNMLDLGTLGGYFSKAYAINDSGQVAGASTNSGNQNRAFLWQNGIMSDLGTLGGSSSQANAINEAGLVVGESLTGNGQQSAVLWDNGTIADLNNLIDPASGWILQSATAVNNLGQIAGYGSYNGLQRAFLLSPKALNITYPKANFKWIAGELDTIKWTGGQENQALRIEFSVDSGSTFDLIDFAIEGDTGVYIWAIPEDILSKKCMIRIYDMGEPSNADTSDAFKIKGYILTRDSSGQYEPFRKSQDQWGFWNIPGDMWPQAWYQQFNYQGIDPFTNSNYSQWQGDFTFTTAQSFNHPDWISWVNAFSVDACYYSTLFNFYKPAAVIKWGSIKKIWKGSCFGIAAASSLAFTWKDQFHGKYPAYPPFQNPNTVNSNDAVKKTINELFTHQYGNPTILNDLASANKTPNQTLNELKQLLLEDEVQPKTISIFGGNPPGGHTILAYKVTQDQNQKTKYYVHVYDNSNPNSNNPITIDTIGNNNNGSWSTPDWPGWNGKIYLEITSDQYLNGAILPEGQSSQSRFILPENILEVNYTSDSQIDIRNSQGDITGYINNQVFEDIPGSVAQLIKNGSVGPPYGYLLPTDSYSVSLNGFTEDTIGTIFSAGNKSFIYERSGAVETQTDRLYFDEGVSVLNPDPEIKTISLLSLLNESSHEKLTVLRSLELSQNDSVKIENPDSNKVKLISYGTAKNYDIELNFVTQNGIGRFGDFNVFLEANTSHTFVPDWTDVTNKDLMVLVDIDNNGTTDDTLYLHNQVTGNDDQGSLLTPDKYNLAQNYPNPFNPTTNISYSIPQTSNVKLVVYDVLGNEISTLVNEEKAPGVYSVLFDASQLASGIYFYSIQAGSFSQAKKMLLIR